MKRDHEEESEQDQINNLQTPIRALVQQSSAHRIYSQLLGERDTSSEGELVENSISPAIATVDKQQPKRLFPAKTQKSDFWSKKLALDQPSTPTHSTIGPDAAISSIVKDFSTSFRISTLPVETTWDRIESIIAKIPNRDTTETLHTLKHFREERAGTICTDPISVENSKPIQGGFSS